MNIIDLAPSEFQLLSQLAQQAPGSLLIRQGPLHRIAAHLEEQGLVRLDSQTDRSWCFITDQGLKLLASKEVQNQK